MKKIDKNKYQKIVKSKEKSPVFQNLIWAFCVGGAICTFGQFISNMLLKTGLNKETTASLTAAILICLSGLFTGLGLYSKLAKHAGAGTLVPITGFANAMVSPAIEFKNEGFIFGIGVKLFNIAGPVIVYGVTSSVIGGIIYYIFGLIF